MFLLLLFITSCLSEVLSRNLFSPCRIENLECQENAANGALPRMFAGNPKLGVKSSDPLFIDEIVGQLSNLKYNLSNSTLTGGKKAYVENVDVDKEFTKAQYDLIFPKAFLSGKYELSGKLFDMDVEGSGDYLISLGKYIVNIDSKFEKTKGEDGKTHVGTKKFKIKSKPIEPIIFEFKNLFNGQKHLSDAVHKFANENWLKIAELVQNSAWTAAMKLVFQNFNEYLKHETLEDFILN